MLAYTPRMDAELKTLLVALAEGQVKLAEGQGRMESAVAHLAEGQGRHDELLAKLAEGQGRHDERLGRMESAVAHLATATEAALTRLTERIDEFGERVTRGFTNGASADRKMDDAIHALDARVTKLEHAKPGPRKRR